MVIHIRSNLTQDLSCTYLAHHELESKFTIIIIRSNLTCRQGKGDSGPSQCRANSAHHLPPTLSPIAQDQDWQHAPKQVAHPFPGQYVQATTLRHACKLPVNVTADVNCICQLYMSTVYVNCICQLYLACAGSCFAKLTSHLLSSCNLSFWKMYCCPYLVLFLLSNMTTWSIVDITWYGRCSTRC